jgi:hypothetical protein
MSDQSASSENPGKTPTSENRFDDFAWLVGNSDENSVFPPRDQM